MKTAILFSVVLAVSLATCLPARATMETSPGGIAWVDVDASKEIDAEFAKAR